MEKEFICLSKVGAETFVDPVNQAGEFNLNVFFLARSDGRRSADWHVFARIEVDGPLAYLLETVELEGDLIVEYKRLPRAAAGKLRSQEPCVCVELFEIAILKRNHL